MAPEIGIEPMTLRLTAARSGLTELPRLIRIQFQIQKKRNHLYNGQFESSTLCLIQRKQLVLVPGSLPSALQMEAQCRDSTQDSIFER